MRGNVFKGDNKVVEGVKRRLWIKILFNWYQAWHFQLCRCKSTFPSQLAFYCWSVNIININISNFLYLTCFWWFLLGKMNVVSACFTTCQIVKNTLKLMLNCKVITSLHVSFLWNQLSLIFGAQILWRGNPENSDIFICICD